jgi:hypothetical protein
MGIGPVGIHGPPTRMNASTPGGDRTPDLLVRSQALCPAELRAHAES